MWICTRYGFFSIVSARVDPKSPTIDQTRMMIRARRIDHLWALIDNTRTLSNLLAEDAASLEILYTKDADYPYRIFIPKMKAAETVAELMLEISFDNFKNEVSASGADDPYIDFLHRTWSNGLAMEERNSKGSHRLSNDEVYGDGA